MAKNKKQKPAAIFGDWDFTRTNYLIFLGGIVIIILAYIIMAMGGNDSFGTLTLAPVMLVIGYLVVIPLAILYRPRKHAPKQDQA
ncbi:MAG: DUF3098 domain-containing protein [Fidelibacterota bacterium]|nr:MAG: DUF3098 domain-containing protein [Candidatus Neomarinimicrobiota bacterium]